MIIVSRLNGERFGINAEHIERIEETPDTVLTLVEGRKYIVRESLEDVIEKVVAYRARVLRVSYIPAEPTDGDEPPLRLVHDSPSDTAGPRNGVN
jgi:flagellar protein FlbD